jgi:hypothetical protein
VENPMREFSWWEHSLEGFWLAYKVLLQRNPCAPTKEFNMKYKPVKELNMKQRNSI